MALSGNERKMPSGLIAFKKIVEGTSQHTGTDFFESLVKNLAEALEVHGVWVTEYLQEQNRLRSIAFWLDGSIQPTYEYDVPGTPCEPVLESNGICHIPDRVIELFPNDPDLKPLGGVSYMGLGLWDKEGNIMGHLALLDNRVMEEIPEAFSIFKIFANRAEAELRRLKFEKLLMENEAKLNRLINGTMDLLIEFNGSKYITQANEIAKQTFNSNGNGLINTKLQTILDQSGFDTLSNYIILLDKKPEKFCSTMIDGTINFIHKNNEIFPAETTVSRYLHGNQNYYALFIRNVSERIRDKQALKFLNTETTMLREKISKHDFEEIIGDSPAIHSVLRLINQVAPIDTTVLVSGETGTGKELFARAIHKSSRRKGNPLVTLNCAALPSELVESELFGHQKGAFTGATTSREGRFLLADGGSIFLDEIGELPLELQAKLLRVLQEGEFEPVGSSKTQKVNVRIIAATNRNLAIEVKNGRFREDLYYRLNVFPIHIPPLRERGEDINILAEAFIKKFSQQSALKILPLNKEDKHRLQSYHWPGNVRELQNIIERGVITHINGQLNLNGLNNLSSPPEVSIARKTGRIIAEPERIALEKENIINALKEANWKISGENGAAALLQIPPTTLNSRIAKLGIRKIDA